MDKITFHSMIGELLALINANKDDEVTQNFGISKEVICEIREVITDYFGHWQEVKPLNIARHSEARVNKPLFNVFEMNQLNTYGVECVLVDADENETELILHAEFVASDGSYKMDYQYIGS